jgi:hypothetical protein
LAAGDGFATGIGMTPPTYAIRDRDLPVIFVGGKI